MVRSGGAWRSYRFETSNLTKKEKLMSIFSDFNDNVITPAVDAYTNVTTAQTTSQIQQAAVNQANATSATASGSLGLGGVSNSNPQIITGVNNSSLIIVAVLAVVAYFIFRK